MLKRVCQKCYEYHERKWNRDADIEWSEGGVFCPVDLFNVVKYKGKMVESKECRGVWAFVFGWNDVEGLIPEHCEFREEHEEGKVD